MTSIGVIKMIDNHPYVPTTRLYKEKSKRKGSEYREYPFNCLLISWKSKIFVLLINH